MGDLIWNSTMLLPKITNVKWIKSALLSANANSTTVNYMYLRHFLNPVGETAIGIGDLESLRDE